ncbi:MAG: DUF4298 domain-containing protein [Bacillota bacterium]|nr:DUF4298 domain-containing protein [Bacillota bacterium]
MNVEKIKEMEEILDRHQDLINQLDQLLFVYEQGQEDYDKLRDYYFSQEYLDDFEEIDKNGIPAGLKCGVLSEDGIYNLIGENFHLAISMLELATKILKNH